MQVREELRGVFPVLPTIYDKNGEIDLPAMRGVLDYIIAAGADGIVFPGLASEYDQLSVNERITCIAFLGAWCADRTSLVIGASAETIDDSTSLVVAGAAAGAAAAMVMTPKSLGDDVEAQIAFYTELSRNAELPLMLQNAPAPMGVGLSTDKVVKIVTAVPGIEYVKEETAPCGPRIQAITNGAEHLKGVFGGAGGRQVIDELIRGAVGTVPACEITELHVGLVQAFADGHEDKARDLFDASMPLLMMQAVFRWRLTKYVLGKRGLIDNEATRAPGPALDDRDRAEIDTLLTRLGDNIDLTIGREILRDAAS